MIERVGESSVCLGLTFTHPRTTNIARQNSIHPTTPRHRRTQPYIQNNTPAIATFDIGSAQGCYFPVALMPNSTRLPALAQISGIWMNGNLGLQVTPPH